MEGLIIGIVTFFMIGIFHPIVIKGEYYFGVKLPCVCFIIVGICSTILSLVFSKLIVSIIFGVLACCAFWSIKEMQEQEERVLKGWFPENPKRSAYYANKRITFFKKHPEFQAMYEAKNKA